MAQVLSDGYVDRVAVIDNGRSLSEVVYEYTLKSTESISSGDTVKICDLPEDAQVHDAIIASEDIDSGTAVVMSLGDSADADRYIKNSTVGQAGGVARLDNLEGLTRIDSDAKKEVLLTMVTAPGTQVNNKKVKVLVRYSSDQTY